jgi:hypothetical protein
MLLRLAFLLAMLFGFLWLIRWLPWYLVRLLHGIRVTSAAGASRQRAGARVRAKSSTASEVKPKATSAEMIEDLVACCRCQLYLPKQEAVYQRGQIYCCREHAAG